MQRGSGGMQDGGQGTGSLHTWEEGKKGFPKKPAAQSASPASHPFSLSLSPGSSFPSPSTSLSLAGRICNDCAAQDGRVWRRLISQSPGMAPLHRGQKQISFRGCGFLNQRFCIISLLLHPSFIAGE